MMARPSGLLLLLVVRPTEEEACLKSSHKRRSHSAKRVCILLPASNITNNLIEGGLAVGFVVLISLAIALLLIFLIVLAGIIAERIRKKREGYMPAPTSSYDRGAAMTRMPPQQLFSSIGQNRSGIEKQSTLI